MTTLKNSVLSTQQMHAVAELEKLLSRQKVTDLHLRQRVTQLSAQGIPQEVLAAALGKSQATVSRMVHQTRDAEMEPHTAMELVRRAARGEVSHEELIEKLKTWDYDPPFRTDGLSTDWGQNDNSVDAIDIAFYGHGLLSEEEYFEILGSQE